jgi:hypothetical protein
MRRTVAMALVLLALTACANERDTSTRTPAPSGPAAASASASSAEAVDRAAFVAAVNDACREYAERDEALASPEELDEYVAFMRAFIDNAADLDAKLEALDPPVLINDFNDYVAGNRRQTGILRAALPKVEAAVRNEDQAEGDVAIDDAIDAFNEIADDLDPYARRNGFDECTSEPGDEEA